MNRVYVPFRVPPEHLGGFLTDARKMDVKGLSVTIPHKEAVMSLLTNIDSTAQAVRAANTVLFNGAEAVGYNTDYPAAIEALEAGMGQRQKAQHCFRQDGAGSGRR